MWIACKDKMPPQDGTPILLWDSERGSCIGFWVPEQESSQKDGITYIRAHWVCEGATIKQETGTYWISRPYGSWSPTHWCPLPPPPSQEK